MTQPATPEAAPPPLDVSALLTEAATKSSIAWIGLPDTTVAVWHVWHESAVAVVTGPGEQRIPRLPDEVDLVLRSKDSGGRLLTVRATVESIANTDDRWELAAGALSAARLNATDDQIDRWRAEGTVYLLRPYGQPRERPGAYDATSGARPVTPGPGTTAGWRPRHLGGRGRRRRRR